MNSFAIRTLPRAASYRPGPVLFVASVLIGGIGCQRPTSLETQYGLRDGRGLTSVNGTLVLSKRFEQAGYRVSSWRRLSPKLNRDRVIVWVPDRFGLPEASEIDFLESWLSEVSGRTLVFVGRDYDAAIEYWRRLLPGVTGAQRIRVRQQLARAQAAHATRRVSQSPRRECAWFSLDFDVRDARIEQVRGPLTAPTGPLAVDLPMGAELKLKDAVGDSDWADRLDTESLLTGGGRVLAARLSRPHWNGSQVIVIADGSWLLNLPQVDPPNRELAGALIAACGPPDRVCFLESGSQPLQITPTDTELPLLLQLFTVWPVNLFMLHLVLVGIIYCLYVWPIFGRPRHLPDDKVSDFGKHLTAVGELMERGQDYAYAKARINEYQELRSAKSATEGSSRRRPLE